MVIKTEEGKLSSILRVLVIPSGVFPAQSASSINVFNHAKSFSERSNVTLLHDNEDWEIIGEGLNQINLIKLQRRLNRYSWIAFNSNKFDLIFSRNILLTLIGVCFSVRSKFVVDVHARPTDFGLLTKICFLLVKRSKRVNFVFITKPLLEESTRYVNTNRFILNDVSAWRPSPVRKMPTKVVYFGSLDESKNWRIIVKCAREMPDIPFKVFALHAPKDFPVYPNLELEIGVPYMKLAEKINQEASLVLIPNLESQNLRGVDIGKFTSPLKLFDALALEKRIICNDIEVLKPFHSLQNVIVANSSSVNDWVEAIKREYNNGTKCDFTYSFPVTYNQRVEAICELIHAPRI